MNTEKQLQLCSQEQAKRLKELGFDWYCHLRYDNDGLIIPINKRAAIEIIKAPTIALALKLFRDAKGRMNYISVDSTGRFDGSIVMGYNKFGQDAECTDYCETYEAAESALLDELLTLIEKQNEQTN